MKLARRYLISGLVQGVGFRYFILQRAGDYGIDGWTRNLPDGSVEVFAEGDREALEEFERDLRQGPGSARVTGFSLFEETPSGTAGFRIR